MSEKEPRFYDHEKVAGIPEGMQLGSVTSIGDCAMKYGLLMFYGKYGIKEAQARSKEAAMIGTGVHEYASDILRGHKLGTPDSKFKKPIDNLKKFLKKYKPEPLFVEQPVYSLCETCMAGGYDTPHICTAYAGTLDAIVKIGNKVFLLDWKTSKAIYPDYRMQAEAYYQAVLKMKELNVKVDGMMLVQLDKELDFNYEDHVMEFETNGIRNYGFIGLLNYFRWSKVFKAV